MSRQGVSKDGESISIYRAAIHAFYRNSILSAITRQECKQYERDLKWIAAYLIGNGVDCSLTKFDFPRGE